MAMVTTGRQPKEWSWSYSKLKNFETCPKRHFHVDVQRDVREPESEELRWGNEVHKHLAARIEKGTPLPMGYEKFEPWAQRIVAGPGTLLVEQKLAITKTFAPCTYFDNQAWYRGIADVLRVDGPVALAIDWKTGKIVEDSVQLALVAACIFAHYSEVQIVRAEFVWLKEGDNVSSREDFKRNEMVAFWRYQWPRIEALRQAHETTNYPAKPGYLCRKWCPVTQCPHNGRS